MITGDIRQKYRIDEEAEETWYEVEKIISRNKEYFTYFVECCSSYNYQDIRKLFVDKGKDFADQFEAVDLIHKKKYLFKTILEKGFVKRKRPFVIEFIGTPRTGKTTVINMLTRFYDVQKGAVRIDGIDVRDVTLRSLRREVGVLMQDPFIFKGTIMDNIRYGKWGATDEQCIESARLIHADRFIERFPDGYQHKLEERGSDLSAGERQLISFARIVLKNPSIIIMDEATSAIDTDTEMIIKEALDELTKDKTTFIVAHRLSTIKNADEILYIGNKGILESGKHEELLRKKGYYYELACS
jgi:ATP-binding cassette subfamily B protein